MGDVVKKKRLRMLTYMSPSIPVEVFETIRDYVEKITGLQASLIYESRWSGPPAERDPDPLKNDDIDIAFMCTTGFRRLLNENNKFAELCKAAPVYIHPNNNANQPIFFSDIIIHADSSTKYENFVDLKGCRWAYSDHVSLSGNLMALSELRRRGYDSNFFGTVIQSGSSLKSIDMLLEKKVDAASVDSTCLQNCFRKDPSLREKIKIFKSLGPLPVQPIIFNSRLPDDTKKLITEGLLAMDKDISWNKKLKENNILRFHPIDLSFYDLEANLQEIVKGLSINTAYY